MCDPTKREEKNKEGGKKMEVYLLLKTLDLQTKTN
jgi:hypothetical protein